MDLSQRILAFSLDAQRYGISLDQSERVIAAVAVTPLPHAPAIVLGVFNLQGRIVPVMNVRRRFSLPERPIALADQFLIARAGDRTVALVVDGVEGVIETSPDAIVAPTAVLPELRYVEGVVRRTDGIVFIHDLITFLNLDESAALEAALASTEKNPC